MTLWLCPIVCYRRKISRYHLLWNAKRLPKDTSRVDRKLLHQILKTLLQREASEYFSYRQATFNMVIDSAPYFCLSGAFWTIRNFPKKVLKTPLVEYLLGFGKQYWLWRNHVCWQYKLKFSWSHQTIFDRLQFYLSNFKGNAWWRPYSYPVAYPVAFSDYRPIQRTQCWRKELNQIIFFLYI